MSCGGAWGGFLVFGVDGFGGGVSQNMVVWSESDLGEMRLAAAGVVGNDGEGVCAMLPTWSLVLIMPF
jgi:hypothetical protein